MAEADAALEAESVSWRLRHVTVNEQNMETT